MAILTGSFQSKELFRKVSFTAVIPTTTRSIYEPENAESDNKDEPLKTLYLLHGWDGNHEDWLHNTRIAELAIKHHVAIIMPDGQNSFYVDQPNGDHFGKFIGEEFVHETRRLFHLSDKREDTTIGGLSMGGYGALRNGFYYPKTFGNILVFSSKIFTKRSSADIIFDQPISWRYQTLIKGETTAALPGDMDIEELAVKAFESKEDNPRLYLSCGTEDDLIDEQRSFHRFLKEHDYAHEYVEAPGMHNWDYWNTSIEQGLEWLYGNAEK